ncbi:7 transmembrane receptor [Opisthorchis viverrini]|uniref:7 transmembrane receptor n=1 Tax=Opisthorchis viverrini TaxID=6198 RepID=A0A1S8X4T3_OPIVI|nr:7 transmembrane receptor [Opisthorchis viverrini]
MANCTINWLFEADPQLREIILPIWCTYAQPGPAYFYFSSILTTFIGFVGVAINLFALYVLTFKRSMQQPFNWFMINLAISDLGMALTTCVPLKLVPSIMKRWIWGKQVRKLRFSRLSTTKLNIVSRSVKVPVAMWLCHLMVFSFNPSATVFNAVTISLSLFPVLKGCMLYGFSGGLFGFASFCTLAVIAFGRYYAVVKNFNDPRKLTGRTVLLIIIFVWQWSALWPLLPFFGIEKWHSMHEKDCLHFNEVLIDTVAEYSHFYLLSPEGRYVLEGFLTACTFDYVSADTSSLIFGISLYVGGFLCPLAVIVYAYVGIICFVRKTERQLSVYSTVRVSGTNRLQMKASKWSALLTLLYLFAWGPYALICGISLLGYQKHLTPYVTEFPGLFAKLASIYNPLIYVFRHSRTRAKNVQGCRFCRRTKSKIFNTEGMDSAHQQT